MEEKGEISTTIPKLSAKTVVFSSLRSDQIKTKRIQITFFVSFVLERTTKQNCENTSKGVPKSQMVMSLETISNRQLACSSIHHHQHQNL